MEILKLVGILIVVLGFIFKLDTIAVVIIAGIATGLASNMNFNDILTTIGTAFISTRYMTLLLLTLSTIGILERNGLRERATKCILKLKGATCGKVLSIYVIIRTLAGALSLRLGGHIQFIRPLVYPMAKGAAEKSIKLTEKQDEELKALANSMENYGNFFGQNIFVASSGVLLILGTLKELGITEVSAYDLSISSIPIGVVATILAVIRGYIFDIKLRKKGE